MKAAIFHPAARAAIRLFPADVRRELGKAIFDLQKGETLSMPLSRPIPTVAGGAFELRMRDRSGIYRTIYFTKSARGIMIFHAFVKKSQKSPQRELDLARTRLKELLHEEI